MSKVKVPFDFTDADLLMDVKLRTKDRQAYYRIIFMTESIIVVGQIGITYEQLRLGFEYYNRTMRQWMPCEKVG